MALYVFGIGGTGARVIKALTFLMASGVQLSNTNAVIPMLIDPDGANGDLNRTLKLLDGYRYLRSHTEQDVNKFFFNEVRSLWDASGNNTSSKYHFSIEGIGSQRFKSFIDLGSQQPANQAMTQLLFSEHNLNADMQVGFKGNPNIGSVVLNKFKDSEGFKAFAAAFNQNDRIAIIGSIFGGTGAAGLPLLIKNLREAAPPLSNAELLKNAPIAAISVLPYFDVQGDTTIDSDTFISKTKAALSYYANNICKNQSLNALYYLGDAISNTQKGADGAGQQQNKAHFVELAAALAIVDFMKKDRDQLKVENGKALAPKYFEYGLKEATSQIQFKHLGKQTFDTAGKSLTQYFLFQKFFRDCYTDMPEKTAWLQNGHNKLNKESLNSNMLDELGRFNDSFNEWLQEMEQSTTSFSPFRRDVGEKDILNTVIGFDEKTSFMAPKGMERYIKTLNAAEEKLPPLGDSNRKLFGLFYNATKEIINERINLS